MFASRSRGYLGVVTSLLNEGGLYHKAPECTYLGHCTSIIDVCEVINWAWYHMATYVCMQFPTRRLVCRMVCGSAESTVVLGERGADGAWDRAGPTPLSSWVPLGTVLMPESRGVIVLYMSPKSYRKKNTKRFTVETHAFTAAAWLWLSR